jgi:hypothetical protein
MAQPTGVHKLFQTIRQQPLLLWPLLSLLIPSGDGFSTPMPTRQLLEQELTLPSTGEVKFSKDFVLDEEAVGATRLYAKVGLPVNSALSLSTELLNASNEVVLAFDKEGWRERGTWNEDGQSGIYDESDSYYEVFIKPNQSGQYRLRFAVDGLEDQAGNALQAQLPLRVDVQDRRIDEGLISWTNLISFGIILMFLNSIYCQGRRRFGGRIDDLLEASSCTRMNYEKGVIMIKIVGRYEIAWKMESSLWKKIPRKERIPLNLEIIDGNGAVVNSEQINICLTKKSASDEDDPPYWHFQKRLFFYNPKLQSLRFRLSMPERVGSIEQEWLDFDLRDRIVSMRPLCIRRIN